MSKTWFKSPSHFPADSFKVVPLVLLYMSVVYMGYLFYHCSSFLCFDVAGRLCFVIVKYSGYLHLYLFIEEFIDLSGYFVIIILIV